MNNSIKKAKKTPEWVTVWEGTSGQNEGVSAPIGNPDAVRITYYCSNGYSVGATYTVGAQVGTCFAACPEWATVRAGVATNWLCHSGGVSYGCSDLNMAVKIKKIETLTLD